MNTKRPQMLSSSSKYYVILVTLVYTLRFANSTTTNKTESFEDFSVSSTLSSESPSTPSCKLVSNSTLDCSNLELSEIPKSISNSILQLNLSHNSFQNFESDAFDECCENVTVLDLSNNDISSLTRRHFERLKSLEVLLLSSNKINSLAPDIFVNLTKLKRLDLRSNSLELQSSKSEGFLISSSLEELNLDDCGINEIPDGTFNNMTQLRNLTLAGNLFDDVIDTSPFEPLRNLLKLRINNLSKTSIYMLCEKLVAIDIINFDEYNISCTVLSDDVAFEESIISNDPVEEPRIDSVISPPTTTRKAIMTVLTTSSTIQPSPYMPTAAEMSTALPQPELIETSDQSFTNVTKIDTETAAIDIDNETIKFILLGIFVFTILGILIGLVCRADICGIKTKLCRTKKTTNNRRTPTDTVSPFEEIPLNSVNGKTSESQA